MTDVEDIPFSKLTLMEVSDYCSSSQDRADACNDYDRWNTEGIRRFALPLSVIPPISNTGAYMAPIDRYKSLRNLLVRIVVRDPFSRLFVTLLNFPDLLDMVLLYGTADLINPKRKTLSAETTRYLISHVRHDPESIMMDIPSQNVADEMMTNFKLDDRLVELLSFLEMA